MDQLLARLNNVTYELFGVFLPGFIGGLFLIVLWVVLGPLVPHWSSGLIPQIAFLDLLEGVGSMSTKKGIGLAVPAIIGSYFIGHILVWVSRRGDQEVLKKDEHLTIRAILFDIPKPEHSYDPDLQPLYSFVEREFAPPGGALPWRQFYPVLKHVLAEKVSASLVTTYQNKYTLHRSLTAASASLFWLSAISFLAATVSCLLAETPLPYVPFVPLVSLMLGSVVLVWGFSGSYMYNWTMFGNSIITEAYALLRSK